MKVPTQILYCEFFAGIFYISINSVWFPVQFIKKWLTVSVSPQ